MIHEPMFLDDELFHNEKTAGTLAKLGDNVDRWPTEVTQEAYKRLPYLNEFEVNAVVDKVDEGRGFAFGSIEVRTKTALNAKEQANEGIKKVHIPIIVKNNMLAPFDIFLNGKRYEHLTEGRLRSALFRAAQFDGVRDRPYEPSLAQDLNPPFRSGLGMKMASAMPLLPQLQGRVTPEQKVKFASVYSDPSVQMAVANGSDGTRAAFTEALGLDIMDTEKTAQSLVEAIPATVVQIRKQDGQYIIKTANPAAFAPQETPPMPAAQAAETTGTPEQALPQAEGAAMTASAIEGQAREVKEDRGKVIDTFGLYKTQDVAGNQMIGWVFPIVYGLDLVPKSLSLFNNGTVYGLQSGISGELAGKSIDLPRGQPSGYGCFYFIDDSEAKVLEPMTIKASNRGPDGLSRYVAETEFDGVITFSFSESLKAITKAGGAEYVFPDSWKWMPLRTKVELIADPESITKVSSYSHRVQLVGGHGGHLWRGPSVEKLAYDERANLKPHEAEFLGVAMGIDRHEVSEALQKTASGWRTMDFEAKVIITPLRVKLAAARETVAAFKELEVPIYNLVKEATVLEDASSADKILGLGFLNADNVSVFIDLLPSLEETSSKMAELLASIRLGLKDVPEAAVERMMISLESVINGLKSLQQKEIHKV